MSAWLFGHPGPSRPTDNCPGPDEFQNAIEELDQAAPQYKLWMTEAGRRPVAGQLNRINEGFREAYAPYRQKRDALPNAPNEFAAEEFHSEA